MLWTLETLRRHGLRATDGSIGRIGDLYFDDYTWTVRYVVVDTGNWLTGRTVLIAPSALGPPDEQAQEFPVALTRAQIEQAPGIDRDKPVNRQQEIGLVDYFGWQAWWKDGQELPVEVARLQSAEGDPNLRSAADAVGYAIAAVDGEIGSVSDFLTNPEDWRIRRIVLDTGSWLSDRQVMLMPDQIRQIDWAERTVRVDLSREQIRNSPPDRLS